MRSTEPIRTDPPDPSVPDGSRPRLPGHLRLVFDPARGQHVLLGPESVTVLNATAAATLELCDGRRTVPQIIEGLRASYRGVDEQEVAGLLGRMLAARRLEVDDG